MHMLPPVHRTSSDLKLKVANWVKIIEKFCTMDVFLIQLCLCTIQWLLMGNYVCSVLQKETFNILSIPHMP